ncbi:glycosyltransferase family 4 protein [Edaphocola aurantiacus]|uniref:glycosyltransferase family 4 protein n=1 Tax=Edaphocola aurantiacus TaxID=2601682 RepID=UPI001C987D3B|nr:glycosyltransferase family 4 protein [Edaphocola aurantiacus]
MKIVYCTGALYKMGGAERVLISKANYLADRPGNEVWIITADQRNQPFCFPLNPKIHFIDAAIHQLLPKRIIPVWTKKRVLPKIVLHYQAIIDQVKPDIIIVNELGYDDEVIPKLQTSAKIIREFHSSHKAVEMMISEKADWKVRLQTRAVNNNSYRQFNNFDCIVLLTEQDRKQANYRTQVAVIPNTLLQPNEVKSQLHSKKAITVGRLDRLKNHIDQLKVWKEVIKTYPDWTLHIYGEGPERPVLEQYIDDNGLTKHVFLEGVSTDIASVYSNASLMLFSSLAEGFGMVLIEAMSAGVPCISYNTPCGPSEIIDNGKDGWLVPPGDISQMTEYVIQLIASEEKRAQMGRAAVEKSKQYLPEQIMPKWEALFEQLTQSDL